MLPSKAHAMRRQMELMKQFQAMQAGAPITQQAPAPTQTSPGGPTATPWASASAPAVQSGPGAPPPAGPQTPAPATEEEIEVRATPTPAYDGPLAMDPGRRGFRANMSWPERFQVIGATMQQMADNRGQIGATVGNIEQRQREETAQQALRRIYNTLSPELQDVVRMAPTADAALGMIVQIRQQEAQNAQADRRLGQGDSELELRRTGQDRDYELGRGRLDVDRTNAQTSRAVADAQIEAGGRDPLTRGLINADVDALSGMTESMNALQGMLPDMAAFESANEDEPGTGPGSFGTWAPLGIGRNTSTQDMRAITARLAPTLRQAGSGAMSDRDLQLFLDSLPGIGNDRATNNRLIGRLRVAARRAAEREQYAREYLQRDRSLSTFNRLWSAYINDAQISEGDTRSFAEWMRAAAQDQERERPGPDQ